MMTHEERDTYSALRRRRLDRREWFGAIVASAILMAFVAGFSLWALR